MCTGTDGYLLAIRYDELGRILESTNADGTVTLTYNDQNQVTSETDREGNTIYYEHDGDGNVSQVNYPDGTTERYGYNADNLVTRFVDRNGNASAYA